MKKKKILYILTFCPHWVAFEDGLPSGSIWKRCFCIVEWTVKTGVFENNDSCDSYCTCQVCVVCFPPLVSIYGYFPDLVKFDYDFNQLCVLIYLSF